MIKENTYITIQAFMVNQLKLKGNELLIYAIIFGYSQDGDSKFNGSIQYLADWTNSTKRGVMNNLKSLQSKGLIFKEETYFNNLKFCKYGINFNYHLGSEQISPLAKEEVKSGEQSSTGVVNKVPQGGEQSSPNNIDIYNSNYNNIGTSKKKKTFQRPKIEEIQTYCLERKSSVDSQKFYDYYESNGWKVGKNSMKDWKAAIRNWERNQKITQNHIQNKHDFKETLTEEDYTKYDRF